MELPAFQCFQWFHFESSTIIDWVKFAFILDCCRVPGKGCKVNLNPPNVDCETDFPVLDFFSYCCPVANCPLIQTRSRHRSTKKTLHLLYQITDDKIIKMNKQAYA